jgi:hypothetical protein
MVYPSAARVTGVHDNVGEPDTCPTSSRETSTGGMSMTIRPEVRVADW